MPEGRSQRRPRLRKCPVWRGWSCDFSSDEALPLPHVGANCLSSNRILSVDERSLGSADSFSGGSAMRLHHKLLAATILAHAAPALAGPAEDFQKLQDDYWATTLRENPLLASQVGVMDYDRELGVISLAEFDRQAGAGGAFLKRPCRR